MSIWSTGSPCPQCISSDAYKEGQFGWKCFSCQYYKPKDAWNYNSVDYSKIESNQFDGTLPSDCFDSKMPEEYKEWIVRYLHPDLLQKYCAYSKFYNRLIFPINYQGKLMCWQGRAINREPKWLTKSNQHPWGKKFPYISGDSNAYVITEDIISAIKVSQVHPAISILGSNVNQEYVNFLLTLGSEFIIWLDNDEAGRHGTQLLFDKLKLCAKIKIVNSEYDPKEYSLTRIEEYLK